MINWAKASFETQVVFSFYLHRLLLAVRPDRRVPPSGLLQEPDNLFTVNVVPEAEQLGDELQVELVAAVQQRLERRGRDEFDLSGVIAL